MSLDWNRINECRMGYIDKRNRKNEEIGLENGLTDNQIEAIEDICRMRHEIHSLDVDSIRNGESADCNLIENNLDKINNLISENELPELLVKSYTYEDEWITDCDWYYGDAKEEYAAKAQTEVDNGFEFDTDEKKIHFFPIHDIDELAFTLFIADAAERNTEIKEKINEAIENWLLDIDKKYQTNYCPIGGQRF